jgi:hypothetical protein
MKKNYESPKMEVYELQRTPSLLAGSDPEGQGTGGDQNGQGL